MSIQLTLQATPGGCWGCQMRHLPQQLRACLERWLQHLVQACSGLLSHIRHCELYDETEAGACTALLVP